MLRIATIEGAQTIGLGDSIGSLESGKKADFLILNLKAPHMTPILSSPIRNIAPNIVYSARGDEVETIIINGKIVMEDRHVLTMEKEKVIAEAQKAAEEMVKKSDQMGVPVSDINGKIIVGFDQEEIEKALAE